MQIILLFFYVGSLIFEHPQLDDIEDQLNKIDIVYLMIKVIVLMGHSIIISLFWREHF